MAPTQSSDPPSTLLRSKLLRVALGTISLIVLGCGGQTKIKECNSLVAIVNGSVDKIQKVANVSPDGGTPVSELRSMADTMDEASTQCEAIEFTLSELKKYSEDYQKMAKDVAGSARELASAVDKVDMEKMSKAQARMEEALKNEDPIVEGINTFCRNP